MMVEFKFMKSSWHFEHPGHLIATGHITFLPNKCAQVWWNIGVEIPSHDRKFQTEPTIPNGSQFGHILEL